MSKAYLELKEVPTSCIACKLRYYRQLGYPFNNTLTCFITNQTAEDYTNSRHPDCPLVIVDEGLPVVWDESSSFTICQKCKGVVGYEDSYCNHCGVKLAPLAEANDD